MSGSGNREHERKFLVQDLSILDGLVGNELEQGYLFSVAGWKARARRERIANGDGKFVESQAMFTLKGPKRGTTSPEYEFALELPHAMELVELAPFKIQKTRYPVLSEGNAWEVDVFHGANQGLVVAEFEASTTLVEALRPPWWSGPEVTADHRYSNEYLAEHPWASWATGTGT